MERSQRFRVVIDREGQLVRGQMDYALAALLTRTRVISGFLA